MNKIFLSADQLLAESYRLGLAVFESGFRPDLLVGIWRGGAPVAIAIHELLHYLGHDCDHMPVRTSSYAGIGRRSHAVSVAGVNCLPALTAGKKILLVDDVFDTGLSIQRLISELEQQAEGKLDIRIATVYYKPANNRTSLTPDLFLHRTDDWLVFPHELDDLPLDEVMAHKPAIAEIAEDVARLRAEKTR